MHTARLSQQRNNYPRRGISSLSLAIVGHIIIFQDLVIILRS